MMKLLVLVGLVVLLLVTLLRLQQTQRGQLPLEGPLRLSAWGPSMGAPHDVT